MHLGDGNGNEKRQRHGGTHEVFQKETRPSFVHGRSMHLNLGSSVGHVWRHTVALLLQFSDKIGEAPY